jgi:peptidyl-prolyl cis-trans isomerase B (cyclophilin B)
MSSAVPPFVGPLAADPRRRRTGLWLALSILAFVLIAAGGGTLILYATGPSNDAAKRLTAGASSEPPEQHVAPNTRATGPNGGPLAGPRPSASASPSPSGVACDYSPADRGAGTPRLVDPPPARAAFAGEVDATVKTGLGAISIKLLASKAPCTVNSFAHLAEQDYYTDTDCHRLTTDGLYVLQCGDPSGTGTGSPGYQFGEENLPTSNPPYPRGTLAMANAGPGTNGAQFFIVYRDSAIPPAYTVFGTVTAGMDLLDKVAAAGTDNGTGDGRPKLAVHIDEVTIG